MNNDRKPKTTQGDKRKLKRIAKKAVLKRKIFASKVEKNTMWVSE